MPSTGPTRRSLLASAAGGAAAATAGCFSRLRSRITYDPAGPVSLSVKTVPADRDPSAVLVGRALQENLEAAGVDVAHELIDEIQLLRDGLLNHAFDLFVTEVPGFRDPDELRTFLHSRFAPEVGLQNPFGFASPQTDDLIEAQRTPGETDRTELADRLQRRLLAQQPFLTVAARPHTTVVAPQLTVSATVGFASSLSYLLVDDEDGDMETLSVGLQRPNVTENRNVLAVEYRLHDRLTDLLYDPLVRHVGETYVPWLASEFSIDDADDVATVQLRPNLRWHDGERLTAEDVAFTYRLLGDTALGNADSPVPAPRFRQQSSLVTDARATDRTTVEIELLSTRSEIAPSALTVPVLPQHRWRDRSSLEHEYFTEAIVGAVESPVGSGPLRFESADAGTAVTFERYDEHFLRTTSELPESLQPFSGGPAYERLEAEGAPNIGVVLNRVADGDMDVLDGSVPVDYVPDARERENVRVVESPTPSLYVVGINVRRHPLSNYRFRSVLARLLDRDAVVEEVFDGVATATETPLHGTSYVPQDLQWDGESVAGSFPGEDGDLDADAARQLFRDAGFRYHEGSLRGR